MIHSKFGFTAGRLARSASGYAIVLALAAPTAAMAQVADVSESGGITDIVVTARKTSERVQDVPVTITAVNAELIENRALQTVADLEQVTPNLFFQSTSQNSFSQQASLRGISAPETLLVSQSGVGIYVDDVYQATTLTAGAMDTFDLDRVEVLKGPQGTLYGRNTTAGAVLVHSKAPEYGEVAGAVQLRAGNYDEYQGQAVLNLPVGETAALRVGGGYVDRGDGFAFDRSNNNELQKLEAWNVRAAFRANLGEKLQITLRGDYSKSEGSGYAARLRAMSAPSAATPTAPQAGAVLAALQYGFLTPADLAAANPAVIGPALVRARDEALTRSRRRSFEYDPGKPTFENQTIRGVSATLTYDINDDTQLKSITAWRGFRFTYANECCDASAFTVISNATTTYPVPRNLLILDQPAARFAQFSQELQLTGKAVDDRLNYAAGVYYFDSNGRDINNPVIAPALGGTVSTTDGTIFNKSLAGYAQASFEVVDNLRFTAGVRYTDEKVTLDSRNQTITRALTPAATLICDVPAAVRINGQCLSSTTLKYNDWAYTLGLDYKINPDTMVYFRTGNGFKAGGINERGNNGSLPFAPEDVTDYEIGIKTDLLDRRLRINAAAFVAQYKGFQEQTIFAPPGGGITSAIFNVDSTGQTNRVDIRGFEIDIMAKPVDALTLTAAYGHLDPKFKSQTSRNNVRQVISGTPNNTFNASINYEVPVSSSATLAFYAGYTWIDDVDFQPNNGLILANGTKFAAGAAGQEAYGLVDGRITLDLEDMGLTVALYGKNLTNKYYFTGALDLSSSLGPIVGFEGSPRQYGIQLTKKF